MSEIITGVISGLVASAVFYIFLLLVRPKIRVSEKVAIEGETLIRIKVVNRTRCILTNVKYALSFCRRSGEGVCIVEEIQPLKTPLEVMSKYSCWDKNAEYAIRFSYKIPSHIRMSEGWLEFSIHANHGFSNTSACVKKRYESTDVMSGIFETGPSMKILAVPRQNS